MSQKKRVRVYKPGGNVAPYVNTDHFSNYFFEAGGPVDQGMQQAPMQQGQDQSQDLQNVVMMYAQSKGLAEEETQQLFQTILNMQPEEQAQVLAKIQAELTQGMQANPMLERGGYIKQTKKLLNKKIGGISPNATKDNVIGDRKAIVENAIGDYMMRNINDEVANEQMQQMQQMQQYPSYDIGGMTGQWYGGGMGNAYTEDYQNRRQGMLGDVNEFLGNAKDWYSNITPDFSQGYKVKTKGPMFNNSANQLTQNEAAEQMFGLKYGGDIPTYQTAGTYNKTGTTNHTYVEPKYNNAFTDLNIRDEDYANAKKAYTAGNATSEQLDVINRVESYPTNNTTSNTTATNTNNTTATNSNLNGWRGGVFWQDGRAVTTLADMATGAAGAGSGFDYSSLFTPGKHIIPANQMANIFTQQGINRLANTFKGMQPDDVYLSKAKAKMGPFGAKAVLKWEYGPDGTPRQVAGTDEDNQSSSRFPTIGGNNFIDRTRARIQSMRTPSTGGDIPVGIDTPVPNATPTPASMQTSTPTYASPATSAQGAQSISNIANQGVTGNYSDINNPNFYQNEEGQTPFIPLTESQLPTLQGFAIGGRAGKMVIKPGGYNLTGHNFAPFITTAMDAASSILEMPMENEAMLTADAQVPTMYNDRLSRGNITSKGAFPIEMTPQLKPLNEGDRWAQGFYAGPGFSKYGGNTYEAGGMTGNFEEGQFYDLDENDIIDIINNGGTVKYINQ